MELNKLKIFELFCIKEVENLCTYLLRDQIVTTDIMALYFYLYDSLDQHSFIQYHFEACFFFTRTSVLVFTLRVDHARACNVSLLTILTIFLSLATMSQVGDLMTPPEPWNAPLYPLRKIW